MRTSFQVGLLWLLIAILGCASSPKATQKASTHKIISSVCEIGKSNQNIEGTVLIKTNSKEVTGQFPANVTVHAPHQLRLEVTNFLGGTEALITVEKNRYQMTEGQGTHRSEVGFDQWGGIPLRWATDLFLGKIPCPVVDSKSQVIENSQGNIEVLISEDVSGIVQKFVYHVEWREGRWWPESLHWERQSSPLLQVDFKLIVQIRSLVAPRNGKLALHVELSKCVGGSAMCHHWKGR